MVEKNQYTYNVPPGSSANPYGEARSAEFDGTGGQVDGSDGISQVSFNFFHTLWVYRLYIYILLYEMKIVFNNLMGLKV